MITKASFYSVIRSSRIVFSRGIEWNRHDPKSSFDLSDLFWRMCNKVFLIGKYLWHVGHRTVLEISPNSYNSIFHNSLIVRLDASLNVFDFPSFPKSLVIDSFDIQVVTCHSRLEFYTFFLDLQALHLVDSWILRVNLEWSLFFRNRIPCTPFVVAAAIVQILLHYTCPCTPQGVLLLLLLLLLLWVPNTFENYSWSRRRRRESLIPSFLSILGYPFFDAISWHWIVNNNDVRPCLQNCQCLFLCLVHMNPVDDVLRVFQLALIVNCSRLK